jgi:predicted transcriptional regulator
MFEYFNGYWNWASDNPEKVSCTSTAIYFYILSVANELHWKPSFGISSTQIMNGVNIQSYKTYKKHFDELIENGFIKIVQESKNQYKCNVIALVKNTKASPKHIPKQVQSTYQSTSHNHKTYKDVKTIKEYKDYIEENKLLKDEEIIKTFLEFIEMRIKIKKPPTEKSLNLSIKKLRELSGDKKNIAIKIIENSIEANWQTFYPLKDNNTKTNQPTFTRASQGIKMT